MLIIGCDFHPSFQQNAMREQESGEYVEKRLGHRAEAEAFYRSLAGQEVRVGMEACGYYPWFERLLAELGFELWRGDAGQIRASYVRKQKTDRRDAAHLLPLLEQERFPRLWVPSLEERDVRQLLVHRHKQGQARTRVKNQLQALALSQGVQRKRKLWTAVGRAELEKLELLPQAAQRRQGLLHGLEQLQAEIAALDQQVEASAATVGSGEADDPSRGRTGDGIGYGTDSRSGGAFPHGQAAGQLLRADSPRTQLGGRAAVGRISQQGNPLLRFLLIEAGQSAARYDGEVGRFYRRRAVRNHRALAKVAVARKLATRLYWMLRQDCSYAQLRLGRMQVSPSHSVVEG